MTAHFPRRIATTDDIVKAVDTLGFAVDRRLTALEQGQQALVADVADLKQGQQALVADVAGLKTDVAGLKTDVAGLKTDVAGLKQGQQVLMDNQLTLKSELTDVKRGVDAILTHFKIPT